jgi:hypothetical protein
MFCEARVPPPAAPDGVNFLGTLAGTVNLLQARQIETA